MLISLIMVIISQCIHIPKHHAVYLKYVQFLFIKNKILKIYLRQSFKSFTSCHHAQIKKEVCPKKENHSFLKE